MRQWKYMLSLTMEKVLQFAISLAVAKFLLKTESLIFCAVVGIPTNWIFHLTTTKKTMMTIMLLYLCNAQLTQSVRLEILSFVFMMLTKKFTLVTSRNWWWWWWWNVNIFHVPWLSFKFENTVLPLAHSCRWGICLKKVNLHHYPTTRKDKERIPNFTRSFKQYRHPISSSPSPCKL